MKHRHDVLFRGEEQGRDSSDVAVGHPRVSLGPRVSEPTAAGSRLEELCQKNMTLPANIINCKEDALPLSEMSAPFQLDQYVVAFCNFGAIRPPLLD